MFKLEDYETVEERLVKFWKDCPDGRIETELIEASATRFIVMARIFRTEADPKAWTTGHAYEVISDRGVNSTSALENCETSAIGRALANANYATRGKRPSREEMNKVIRVTAKDNPLQDDVWTTEPATAQMSVEQLKEQLNATEVKQPVAHKCQHGLMVEKSGTNAKTGKPYHGFVCTAPRGEQCPPKWMDIDVLGNWRTGWHPQEYSPRKFPIPDDGFNESQPGDRKNRHGDTLN